MGDISRRQLFAMGAAAAVAPVLPILPLAGTGPMIVGPLASGARNRLLSPEEFARDGLRLFKMHFAAGDHITFDGDPRTYVITDTDHG